MTKRKSVWESKNVADAFLESERGAVPGTELQLGIINKIIIEWFPHPERILDIGCGNGILGKYLLGNFPRLPKLKVADRILRQNIRRVLDLL